MRRIVKFLVAAGVVSALAACAGGGNAASSAGPGSTSPQSTAAAPAFDPEASIHVGMGLEPVNLDITSTSGAALQQVMLGNVYESLVGRTQDGQIFPVLAASYEMSTDRLTYTFTLRENLTFADGSPLGAGDIVASLQAAAAPGSANPDAKRLAKVGEVSSPDARTVVIRLVAPDINLLDSLTTGAGVVLPATRTADLATTTQGSGPYTVTKWVKGSTITLTRNENYWGTKPTNKEVVFHYFSDPTAAQNALASGQIDILTTATAEAVTRFRADPAFVVTQGASTSWMTLAMHSNAGPLADVQVRRALRLAIDKQGLIQVIGGNAVQVGSMVATTDPWYDPSLVEIDAYDPPQARQLLAAAGAENLTLSLKVADTYDSAIAEYVKSELGKVGVNVNIETMEFATWLADVYKAKSYELTIVMHVDPWTLTYYGNPAYYWEYNNPSATALVEAALGAGSLAERDTELGKLARLVATDAASEWLYSPQTMLVSAAGVSGFPANRIVNHFVVGEIRKAK